MRSGLTQKYELPYPSGTLCLAISSTCLKPCVVSSARPSTSSSSRALVATVVPWLTVETSSAAEPICSRISLRPSAKASDGSAGTEGVLVT